MGWCSVKNNHSDNFIRTFNFVNVQTYLSIQEGHFSAIIVKTIMDTSKGKGKR